ncbi:POZ [Glarea lozoyensis ATCC 20868]|uniref:Elongin-C n=1 Tax=Glarea lozoyensis (strain ATCC 20868 / MF5171) TaxID=1116229 RepID=S3D165_GLAL2|nr:POZ [Glarea lozoyensis ATCC 20868]EPE25756.1 POZ [Glarea lozoyensis ATCC 20868]
MSSSTQTQGLSKYVTLISSDGFEFVVLREAACTSGAIKRMLDPKSGFSEATTGRCTFAEIKYVNRFSLPLANMDPGPITDIGDGIILEKIAEYFCYNFKNRDREDVPDMEIPPELCLELLMAADYLDT